MYNEAVFSILKNANGDWGPVFSGKPGSQPDDHQMTEASDSMSFHSQNSTTFG